MSDLRRLAALACLSSGYGGNIVILNTHDDAAMRRDMLDIFRDGPRFRPSDDPQGAPRLYFAQPALATFTSERPLTKRQKRRAKGKQ